MPAYLSGNDLFDRPFNCKWHILAIHLDKCRFGVSQLDFLGWRVTPQGVSPLAKKVEAITAFPPQKTPKDLLGFLGALNYYRRSLGKVNGKSPAEVLKPLYEATAKNASESHLSKFGQKKAFSTTTMKPKHC